MVSQIGINVFTALLTWFWCRLVNRLRRWGAQRSLMKLLGPAALRPTGLMLVFPVFNPISPSHKNGKLNMRFKKKTPSPPYDLKMRGPDQVTSIHEVWAINHIVHRLGRLYDEPLVAKGDVEALDYWDWTKCAVVSIGGPLANQVSRRILEEQDTVMARFVLQDRDFWKLEIPPLNQLYENKRCAGEGLWRGSEDAASYSLQ